MSRGGVGSTVAFLLLTLASCGGGTTSVDASAGDGASHTACDPVAQDCPAGTRCDFFCDGQTATLGCRPGATGAAAGQPCSGTMTCAKGTTCLARPDGTVCRPYCASDADCPTGKCHIVAVAVACAAASSTTLMLQVCY